MYSYEDRIRAVKLYIKLDKRIAATLTQLGYPTKNALKTWCREYVIGKLFHRDALCQVTWLIDIGTSCT